MALQMDYLTESKVSISGALLRIDKATYNYNRGNPTMEIALGIYKDYTSSQDGTPPFETRVLHIFFDKDLGLNAHTQAYTALKLIPEFSSAQDVLEEAP